METPKKLISIIIPTNGKRLAITNEVIRLLDQQSIAKSLELIIVSEQKTVLSRLSYIPTNFPVTEFITQPQNGIFMNFVEGVKHSEGEYFLLLDDDIYLTSKRDLDMMVSFLEENVDVWAVGPFIDERIGRRLKTYNRVYNLFKSIFKLWDPDDYSYSVYSSFGKGSPNFSETLPNGPYIGCQWLPNPALLIRRDVFIRYCMDDLDEFNKYYPIQRIWAVDFFLTYRLFLKKKDALAFLPNVTVIHQGAKNTSFDIADRILRETICGYYYYRRYLQGFGIWSAYMVPSFGRLLYIIIFSGGGFVTKLNNVVTFFKSFILLYSLKNSLRDKPMYFSDLNIQREEEVYRLIMN